MPPEDSIDELDGEGRINYPKLNLGDLSLSALQAPGMPSTARIPSPQIQYPILPNTPTQSLDGRVILVTGASQGIGRTVALHLATLGGAIVAQYQSSQAETRELVKTIEDSGKVKTVPPAIAIQADMSRTDDVKALFERARDVFGKIDAVISTVEKDSWGHISEITEEEIDYTFSVNFKSQVFVAQQAYRHVSEHGCLVLVSNSLVQARSAGFHSIYNAGSAAVESLIRSLPADFRPRNVRVNGIVPSYAGSANRADNTPGQDRDNAVPWNSVGYHREVARVVAFLVNGDGAQVNGYAISVEYDPSGS